MESGNRGWEKDLHDIGMKDADTLIRKNKEYGNSWASRGGQGAFFVTARKWDRIENQVKQHGYDIFAALKADTRLEGLRDDIQDLRAYLMLIEAEIIGWGVDLTEKIEPVFKLGDNVFHLKEEARRGVVENISFDISMIGVRWDKSGSVTYIENTLLGLCRTQKVGCRTCEISDNARARRVPRQQPYGYNPADD